MAAPAVSHSLVPEPASFEPLGLPSSVVLTPRRMPAPAPASSVPLRMLAPASLAHPHTPVPLLWVATHRLANVPQNCPPDLRYSSLPIRFHKPAPASSGAPQTPVPALPVPPRTPAPALLAPPRTPANGPRTRHPALHSLASPAPSQGPYWHGPLPHSPPLCEPQLPLPAGFVQHPCRRQNRVQRDLNLPHMRWYPMGG